MWEHFIKGLFSAWAYLFLNPKEREVLEKKMKEERIKVEAIIKGVKKTS